MQATDRRNLLLFAAGLIVAAIGWRIGPGSLPTPSSEVGRGQLVFPGLAAKLPSVVRIAIESAGKTIVLRPRPGGGPAHGGEWGLEDRGGYPVRTDKLRAMLTGLTLIRQISPRTADPALYGQIGVENAGTAGGASTAVSLFAASGKLVAALIVGHTRILAQGGLPEELYIRRPGHRRSWLAQGALTVDANPQLWLDRGILDIPRDRIAGVTVHRAGKVLQFAAGKGKLHLVSPRHHKPLDAYKLDDIYGALQALTLEDVAPATGEPGKLVGTSVFRTTDGLAIAVRVFRDTAKGNGANLWAQFHATGKGAAPLDARIDGWTYRLGAWMERQLVPDLKELEPVAPTTPNPALAPIAPAVAPAMAPATHAPPRPKPTPAQPGK